MVMHSAYIDFFSSNVHKVILGCLIDNIHCFGVREVDVQHPDCEMHSVFRFIIG